MLDLDDLEDDPEFEEEEDEYCSDEDEYCYHCKAVPCQCDRIYDAWRDRQMEADDEPF